MTRSDDEDVFVPPKKLSMHGKADATIVTAAEKIKRARHA